MPPHCQLVMGPAGVGKSTYCQALQQHAADERRRVHVANLDPAAEAFNYDVAFDIRDLISLADVMEEMELGPNGGLLYCMEYLLENMDWLEGELEHYGDDEYIILDCPGQVELYSHVPVMRSVAEALGTLGVRLCAVYLIDATFAADPAKFISGSLLSLSAMVQLELPHLNVLTKCDLVDEEELDRVLQFESASMLLDSALMDPVHAGDGVTQASRVPRPERRGGGGGGGGGGGCKEEEADPEGLGRGNLMLAGGPRLSRLTYAITSLLDDFTMVAYVPLNLKDEESVEMVLRAAESLTQFGEDREPREMGDEEGA